MKSKRTFRWVWIVAGILLVIGAGGYFAMDMAVSYTLKQMAAIDPTETGEAASEASQVTVVPEPVDTEGQASDQSQSEAPVVVPESEPVAEDEGGESATVEASPKEDVTPPSPVEELQEAVGYDPNISSDQAAQVQENVSAKEKLTVAGVLMDNFSAAELREFAAIAAGGITVEEKKAARDTFLSRLSEEEYDRLITIAAKYGLSQGKSYDEVKENTEQQTKE